MIPETLRDLDRDPDFQDAQLRMEQLGQQEITAREARQREQVLQDLGVPPWLSIMKVRLQVAGG
jgi:hypothetical protein